MDAPAVDPARLRTHVHLLSAVLPPRGDNPWSLDASAAYIAAQFRLCSAETRFQEFTAQGLPYRNVVAEFGPRSGGKLVIGAHYDTASGLPGADDNASGVAGLLELGCLLAAHPPARAVELVAYTLEEPPHFAGADMGSYRHAQAASAAGEDIKLMISLEMIGYFDTAPGSQTYPMPGLDLIYPDTGDFIALVGRLREIPATRRFKRSFRRATQLPLYSLNAPPLIPGMSLSDHSSYWVFDFPALMLTDTAYQRNFAYHTEQDTAERLDYIRMAEVVKGVYRVARDF